MNLNIVLDLKCTNVSEDTIKSCSKLRLHFSKP